MRIAILLFKITYSQKPKHQLKTLKVTGLNRQLVRKAVSYQGEGPPMGLNLI